MDTVNNNSNVPRNDYSARISMMDITHEDPMQILDDFKNECKHEFGVLWDNDRHALQHISNHPRTNKIFSLKINGKSCMFCVETMMVNALQNCQPEEAGQIVFNIYKNNTNLFYDEKFLSDLIYIAGRRDLKISKAIWKRFDNEYKSGNINEEAYKAMKKVCYNEIAWDEESDPQLEEEES